MAESTLDLRHLPRADAYLLLDGQIRSVLDGVDDGIAAMATISALVHHAFGNLWTGFYRVIEPGRLLRVGPYQGSLGCLEIRVGHGVCGTSALERRTVIVADVHTFSGHISCDARARSEIVVPVLDQRGELLAVFDIDSVELAAFDEGDQAGLERILGWFAEADR